jgi:hypothetical protein
MSSPAKAGDPEAKRENLTIVMPGLVPGIHVLLPLCRQDVDGRDKPGHDSRAGCRAARMRMIVRSIWAIA